MKTDRRTQRKSSSRGRVWPSDPATRYARDVVAGKIIAGPHVRAACERHLEDLERQGSPDWPYVWDVARVDSVIRFFRVALLLSGGSEDPRPFELLPWQCFVEGSIDGWVHRETQRRRFRTAFIETGKGSGKSPQAAGRGLKMLMADSPVERRAEVYSAAVDREQASILFRDAVAMARLSPSILSRVKFSGGTGRETNIAYPGTQSFFRPISSESTGRGKSGYRPHCVLLDEIHEHPTNAMVEFMRAGVKGREQPLIYMITNSGVDRTSVCYEYHQYGAEVAARQRVDDEFFAYVCAIDEGENPFTDRPVKKLGYPRSWARTNPSIGATFRPEYLAGQVTAAKGMPSKESIVRRLNFCEWVDASNPWIDGDLWRACETDPTEFPSPEVLRELRCFLALDLSAKRDLTALAAVWVDGDQLYARLWFWTPADTLTERETRDRATYRAWVTHGHLEAVPGRSIDYGYVARQIGEIAAENAVAGLAYDPWRITDLLRELDDAGIDAWLWEGEGKPEGPGIRMIRHGQGFGGGAATASLWMPRSIGALEDAILQGRLKVLANPVLRWNSASAVLEQDPAGSKKWEKRKSTGRIDGIVALSMAVGAAAAEPAAPPAPEISYLEGPGEADYYDDGGEWW